MGSVTVIIPVYNREDYLREALDSVFLQTRLPDEVIVVDDGSTDNTPAVAESYPEVKLLRQANSGVSVARNRAVQAATSEWVAFLDSDDVWQPEKLALQMASLEGNPGYDVSTCNAEALLQPGADPANGPQPTGIRPGTDIAAQLRGSLRLAPGMVIARRERVLQVGGFDDKARPCEDWDLWLRLAKAGCQFLLTPEPLLLIRAHESNLSNQSFRMMDAEVRAWERHIAPEFPAAARPLRRQMARSHFLGRVSLVEREQSRPHLGIMLRSLLLWPLGDWRRHKIFLHMLLSRMHLLPARSKA